MLVSIVVPCYNEEDVLPEFYEEFMAQCGQLDYELVFVNDGSRDRTLEILRAFAKKNERVHYLSFSRNFGKESAMYAGLCNARGDYVAVMDADLQDPPALLPQMLEKIQSGAYDSVATRRASRKGEPVVRSLLAKGFYKIINRVSDADIVDGARDYRLMSRAMVDAVIAMTEYNRFSKGIFGWIGFRTYWLPYENVERKAGKTKWNVWKLTKYALDGIFNFSHAPLKFVSGMGIFTTVAAFIYIVYILISKEVTGRPVEGWTSTVSIVLFLGGLQLFSIGIIGQYIARIFLETKNRPHFIIAEADRDDAIKIK